MCLPDLFMVLDTALLCCPGSIFEHEGDAASIGENHDGDFLVEASTDARALMNQLDLEEGALDIGSSNSSRDESPAEGHGKHVEEKSD